MKKRMACLLLAAALCLTACGQPVPVMAADGAEWSEDWVTVGGIAGVDTPAGMVARENSEALAIGGMYYATWSIGEAEPYVNEDGDDAQVYDAQIYFLLAGYNEAEKAVENAEDWMAMANDRYTVDQRLSGTCNGQDFSILTYTFDSDTNPYERGASAFGVYRNYALSVEVSCREDFTGDPLEILTGFLDHCHYSV